jgi:hypothetical protein
MELLTCFHSVMAILTFRPEVDFARTAIFDTVASCPKVRLLS